MYAISLPRLGQTMEYGTIVEWLLEEGDAFDVGDPLYEVETEKVTTVVEAKRDGVLLRQVVDLDEEIPVGTAIAVASGSDESPSNDEVEAYVRELRDLSSTDAFTEEVEPTSEPAEVERSGPEPAPDRKVLAMPKARALAREAGVDLADIPPTGAKGEVSVQDVEEFVSAGQGSEIEEYARIRERRTLSGAHRSMADRVSRSWREIPQFVQEVSVDATGLAKKVGTAIEERESQRLQAARLTYTDLLLESLVRAVERIPEVNASYRDGILDIYQDVNVSIAVATSNGLLAPVLARANSLSLTERVAEFRSLVERAHSQTLNFGEMQGGTITLSNLGMYGIETGVPLVTSPQSVIVFAGKVAMKPWADGEDVAVRPELKLAIAFDHRAIDGATAAVFTSTLKDDLEALGRVDGA